MAVGFGKRFGKSQGGQRTLGSAVRSAGRVALWTLVVLLLFRGVASVLSAPTKDPGADESRAIAISPASSSLAVRFARAYLGGAAPQALAPLLAAGVQPPSPPASESGVTVEQAEVAGFEPVGTGQTIVTVACEFSDGRTVFLAVPIVRTEAGEVAASGAPAVVAGPALVGEEVESPQPLAGSDASAIGTLIRRFLPAYFTASSPDNLSYLLTPGAVVVPPGNGFELQSIPSVKQVGDGEGPRRTVLATVRVRDSVSGSVYDLGYRLEVAKNGRWYVTRVEGALS